MNNTCVHGKSLWEDWCPGCNGSPGSKKENKFTARFIAKYNEWEIFHNGEIMCHISDSDFDMFETSFAHKIERI